METAEPQKRNPHIVRQRGLRFAGILAALALMTALGFYGWRRAEEARAETLADGVLAAAADGVPAAIASLRPVGPLAIDHLRERLNDSAADPVQRLRAAYALADLGQPPEALLLDAIPTAPDAECRNLLAALQGIEPGLKANVLAKLGGRMAASTNPRARARYAIVALALGDPQLAQNVLALRPDPLDRTTFIHAFAGWHGDLAVVAELLAKHDDPALRSGLCAALGTVAWESIPTDQRDAVVRSLGELYKLAPDGGTHSAAGWALRQWKQALPSIAAASGPSADRQWYVNGQGQTMIQLPAGTFIMGASGEGNGGDAGPREVRLTRAFCLADREVTVEQFKRFVDDREYPAVEKPAGWNESYEGWKSFSPTADSPAAVNWFEAVLYCNWLSAKEGLEPAYERTGETWNWQEFQGGQRQAEAWRCDIAANGYRLPTEAEWEYACRATSASAFCFGDDQNLLTRYGWIAGNSQSRAWPGGSKQPNGWGLFDMHGNLWEWCHDRHGPYPMGASKAIDDPIGPESSDDFRRVLRGGAFFNEPSKSMPANRHAHYPDVRNATHGFRPTRTCP